MPALPNTTNISTYNNFGKLNYNQLPPANPITDKDNPSEAQGFSDQAACTQTVDRFTARITLASTTGGLVLLGWWAVWGNVTTTLPILARASTGSFTITLPTVVSSEYQASIGNANTETVNLFGGVGGYEGTTAGLINVSASGCIITIYTFNTSGSLNDMAGSTIIVRVR